MNNGTATLTPVISLASPGSLTVSRALAKTGRLNKRVASKIAIKILFISKPPNCY